MNSRLRAVAGPAVLIVASVALYLPRLENAPPTLRRDEMFHALSARSIAAEGRDLQGRLLPLVPAPSLEMGTLSTGAPPVIVYGMAVVFTVLPFSETTARLVAVIVGVVDVLLVYLIARLLFTREGLAVAAAALMALAPTHFLFSRLALTAQMPLPFVLGWLLCVLRHFRQPNPRLLVAGGALLVGGGLAYFAVVLLIPVYVLLACVAFNRRQEPRSSYVSLIAGIAVPIALCLPWLLLHARQIGAIVGSYYWSDPRQSGGLTHIASLYWHFWDLRFLFADGAPRPEFSTRMTGVFLVPLAGLLAVGALRALQQRSPDLILVLGGFLSAPLAASIVEESHANWRALEVVPFGVLLATVGIERLWTVDSIRTKRALIAALFGAVIVLSFVYHGQLWRAQALLRASLLPLAVLSLGILLQRVSVDQRRLISASGACVAVLLICQIAFFLLDYSTVLSWSVALAGAIGLAMLLPAEGLAVGRLGAAAGLAVLPIVASAFSYFHVERITMPRLPGIPAGAMLPLARLAPGFVAVVAILALARRGRDTIQARPRTSTVLAIAALAALQIAYFHIDAFSDDRARLVHVAVVLVAALSLVMAIRRHILDRRLLESLATAALLTAASLQFAYFYVDYFTDYQRRAYYPEGEVRVVLEDVIARARAAPVPAIHFWGLGGVGLQNLYWKFYLAKHGRDDLLARTTRGEERGDDARERVGQLPPGSLVVTRPSDDAAAALDPLVRAGDLTSAALFRSPDGAPIFWVLERAAR